MARTHVCVSTSSMELLEYVKRVLESVIIQSADVTRVSERHRGRPTGPTPRTATTQRDATVAHHGGGGIRIARRVRHRTVLAGEEIEDMRHRCGRIHRKSPRQASQGGGASRGGVRLETERTHGGAIETGAREDAASMKWKTVHREVSRDVRARAMRARWTREDVVSARW